MHGVAGSFPNQLRQPFSQISFHLIPICKGSSVTFSDTFQPTYRSTTQHKPFEVDTSCSAGLLNIMGPVGKLHATKLHETMYS